MRDFWSIYSIGEFVLAGVGIEICVRLSFE